MPFTIVEVNGSMIDAMISRIQIRRNTAEALGERVEQWRIDHAQAMQVRDLEDWIADAVRLAEDSRALARTLCERQQRNQLNEPFLVREALSTLFDSLRLLCRLLEERASAAIRHGFAVEGIELFRTEANQTEQMESWLATRMPQADVLFDPTEMQTAVEEAERGEVCSHEEAWQRLRRKP